MTTETFSLVKFKLLNHSEACQYIDKYFIQLSDGYHAILKDGVYHKIDPKQLKSIYFNRMPKQYAKYYFSNKTSGVEMQFAIEKKPLYGSIYLLKCNTTGLKYVGSTTKTLEQRLGQHISNYNTSSTKRTSSTQIIAGNNYSIELLESDTYYNKIEMLKRERHFIESMECVNTNVPYKFRNEK